MSKDSDLQSAKLECVKRFLAVTPEVGIVTVSAVRRTRASPGPRPTENVVGIGISDKVTGNRLAGELCVKFYVRKKYSETEIADDDMLPKEVDGVPTDVEEVGLIRATQQTCSIERRRRLRPSPCGVSVGHINITAGTIGAVVRDTGAQDNGRRYILSNNHVLANSNDSSIGDAIFQPGPLDGGTPANNQVGILSRFVRISFTGENNVDCAIAEIQNNTISNEMCSINIVPQTVQAARNMTVLKHGRTTGLTRGIITDTDADIRVDYDEAGVAFFVNTVVVRGVPPTTPFSDGGDSGSVIVDSQGRACALLFAGSSTSDVTFANPIRTVLRRLRIRLV